MNKNETLFYDKLKDIFIGAKIEGNSGFINLMKIKSSYFDIIFKELNKEVNEKIKDFPEFREELFDKLFTFFQAYFSESGSIYFTYTPLKSKIYDKIYTNQNDVILFWKTRMLYYVKTDKLWNNLKVEYEKDNIKYAINFDVSKLQQKSGNEKKNIIYSLGKFNKDEITFFPIYSDKGRTTKTDEICKNLRSKKINLNEEDLDKIFKIFEKQNEVDYFINKNAKEFLKEQFDLWLKNYLFDDETDFSERRLKQLKTLKEIAYKIIDFISQFEDELVKIWNKPKFVLNSNYVITLDRIASKNGGIEIINKILKHKDLEEQIKEWKELGIIDNFEKDKIFTKNLNGLSLNKEYKFLPIDTKYFKDLELDILNLFDNLDNELDGWLIHSENYQALNAILPKFREKIQTIYIDPPFNLGVNADFLYNVNYKNSTWATILENRISLASGLLKDTGNIFVRCDYNGNWIVRPLMDDIFGKDNFDSEIIINRFKKESKTFVITTEFLYFYFRNKTKGISKFSKVSQPRICSFCKREIEPEWIRFTSPGTGEPLYFNKEGKRILIYPQKGRHWTNSQNELDKLQKEGRIRFSNGAYTDTRGKKINFIVEKLQASNQYIGNNWTDIPGYAFGSEFSTQNSEIILKRVIESTSNKGDLVMDFFLGSGTTTSVAQKLKRKWAGVEMGEHFYTVVLPRMKKVLFYDKSEISKDGDVKENYDENNAGGFFKYYDLEQYEQTLRKCHYIPSEPFFNLDDKSIYEQYIFFKDPKLLDTMEIDYKNNKVNVDFNKIYSNIDIAETISLMKGEEIKSIKEDYFVLKDGKNEEKLNYKDLDFKTIKPLIWW